MSEEEPRKAEVNNEPVTVVWRGRKFTIPREYDEWTLDLLESLEEGKEVGIIRGALGPAQWRTVKSMNLKARDFRELTGVITAGLGFNDAGELPASSD